VSTVATRKNETGAAPRAWAYLLRYSNLWGLALLVLVSSLLSPAFVTSTNLLNVLRQNSVLSVVAIGMTLVILGKGIDLSVGSVVALSALTAAYTHESGFLVVVVAALTVGAVVGFVNGFFITKFNIQPFIVTLATMIVARGLVLYITGGQLISGVSSFRWLGLGKLGPVSYLVLLAAALYLLFGFILRRTVYGRHVYAVGGNEEAARLSGIDVAKNRISVYVISGVMAATAGVMLVSRLSVAEPLMGDMMELDAISAVLIGGTTFDGGEGGLGGTLMGVLMLAFIANIFNLMGLSPALQMMIKGLIILSAVLLSLVRTRRTGR